MSAAHPLGRQHLEPSVAQMAPKDDEVKALQAFEGNSTELSPPEQFLLSMASVPRLVSKINILILIHQFEVRCQCLVIRNSGSTSLGHDPDSHTVQAIVHSAEGSIAVVETAIRQVQSSQAFRKVLRAVLATGNLLNAGTQRGNAQGIKLDSLLKLADVKVSFNSCHLLCVFVWQQCASTVVGLTGQCNKGLSHPLGHKGGPSSC